MVIICRGKCFYYKATKPANRDIGRYASGQKRCKFHVRSLLIGMDCFFAPVVITN